MRRRLTGPEELRAALEAREPVRLVLVREGCEDDAVLAAVEEARRAGVAVRPSTEPVLRRFSPGAPRSVLALVGAPVEAALPDLMQRPGPVWLLAGVAYPGNVGCVIRTAEVSGAAGVVIDAPLDGAGRRAALRASMRADRLFPVRWDGVGEALAAAEAAGRRVVALEDAGGAMPWEADLSGDVLLVVGSEHAGLPAEVLAAAVERVRVPMAGFVPSYNVQAAVAALAVELLRRSVAPGHDAGNPNAGGDVTLADEPRRERR